MNHTKTITIVVVVIIIVAVCACAAYALTGDDDDDRIDTTEMAAVYGNANNDYAIDQLDLDMIQSIIDGEMTWDEDEYPFADANLDGIIDEQDLELVQKIINDEECTVYYYNYFGESEPLDLPLNDKKMAVTYWQQSEALAILGMWDNVVCANASLETRGYIYDLSGIVFMGNANSSMYMDDAQCETMLENGVELIIASPYEDLIPYTDKLKEQGVQSIYLKHSGSDCLSTILTLGILLDAEENAEAFIQYWVDVLEFLEERLPAEEDRPSAVIVMMHQDEDSYIGSYGGIFTSVNQPAGEWYLISHICNVFTTEVTGSTTQGRNYYSLEWFIENPFDYMIVMGSGVNSGTQEEYNEWFENMVEKYYTQTQEYADGNILGVTFSFGGYSGYSLMVVLAWMLYPDIFTEEEAVEWMQYYYDNFTDLGTESVIPPQYYTGDGYPASYL